MRIDRLEPTALLDAATRDPVSIAPIVRSGGWRMVPMILHVARGLVTPEFENIHIYDFLCGVLGLTPVKNDGDPAITRAFLRQ